MAECPLFDNTLVYNSLLSVAQIKNLCFLYFIYLKKQLYFNIIFQVMY